MSIPVPNQFPEIEPSGAARIAIVGEAPGRDESNLGVPFIGASGLLLNDVLGVNGIARNQCFVGNVCQSRASAWSDDFGLLAWEGEQVQAGIARLREDLERFNPTIVLCLGNAALHLLKHGNNAPRRAHDGYNWPCKIGFWRGTLFENAWLNGVKCLSTYHPSAVLREYGLQAYVDFDVKRMKVESATRVLTLPERAIGVVGRDVTLAYGIEILARMASESALVSVDIEGGPGNVTCIAFSRRVGNAIVFPLAHVDGGSVWSEEDEVRVWEAVKGVLESRVTPKLAQNGTYDFFTLAWTYGIVVHNWLHDTRQGWWECFPELRASLAAQASILTKEPFYKPDKDDEGGMKFESDDEFWRYNGLDAAVTLECHLRQMEMLDERRRAHYEWKMSLIPMVLYMMLRGIKWDKSRVREESRRAAEKAMELQGMIDAEASRGMPDLRELLEALRVEDESAVAKIVCKRLCGKRPMVRANVVQERWQKMRWNGKRWVKDGKLTSESPDEGEVVDAGSPFDTREIKFEPRHRTVSKLVPFEPVAILDCEPHVLESQQDAWKKALKAWKRKDRAALCSALSLSLNTHSTSAGGDAQRFLYEICGLQRVLKHERTGRLSFESERDWKKRIAGMKVALPEGKRVGTDQNAINKLYVKTQDVRVLWVLQQRRLRKVVTDLATRVDDDSRLRASISLVKETGRMSESISPCGTGLNRQALNKALRRVAVADAGCVMIQRDLSGADSWTVACECALEGDRTMLEDLKAGLKPAKVLALLYHAGPYVNDLDRDALREELRKAESAFPSWLYAGAKSAVHGSSYGMGTQTMIDTLLRFSMGDLPLDLGDAKPLVLDTAQVETLQKLFFLRYPGIHKWHHREGWNMVNKGWFETSTGHRRTIHGRKAEIKRGFKVPSHETLKEVLSSKPQYYTTLGAQLAAWQMWYDGENRARDGSLRVEPLLLVHDSVLAQCVEAEKDFARGKMKQWFENEIEIAGERIVIPADGVIARDWAMKEDAEEL